MTPFTTRVLHSGHVMGSRVKLPVAGTPHRVLRTWPLDQPLFPRNSWVAIRATWTWPSIVRNFSSIVLSLLLMNTY